MSQEDLLLNILKPIELNWFNLELKQYIDIEKQETNINITIGNNRQIYTRQVYSSLDFLGDVGGLLDALRFIGTFLIFIYTLIRGDLLAFFLLNKIFKKDKNRNHTFEENSTIEEKITVIKNRVPFTMQ